MPELPEVETIARGLRERLEGRIVEDLRCGWAPIVGGEPEAFRRGVLGQPITDVRRHGKYLFLVFGESGVVAVHLRMTGQLLLVPGPAQDDPHRHLEFLFRDGPPRLVYRDVRKFGRLLWVPGGTPESFAADRGLGVDALVISAREMQELCRRSARGLKAMLLDQNRLAGVGNIYADEVLFRCRLSPLRKANDLARGEVLRLHRILGEVLLDSIERRGTTVSDYVGASGEPGEFQQVLQVYGREGEACFRCGARILRGKIAGRSTHYCPRCQPVPVPLGIDNTSM